METVMFIGRILFSVMFVLGGLNHFTQAENMTGYAQHKGVPAAKVANLLSGAVLVLGGLSIILGIWADLGALAVSVLLVVLAVMMHDFWKQADAGLFMYAYMATEGSKYGPAITDSLFSASL